MKNRECLLFVLLGLFVSFTIPNQAPKDMMRWGAKEITWDDYKGKPNSPSAAMTMSVIHLGVDYPTNQQAQVTVEALLNRTSSWVRTKTPSLLQHEKGHFDIAELYTRKLRKEIMYKSFKESTFEDELFALHKQFSKQMDAYQDRYDSETDFSRTTEKQKEWTNSIESQLADLKAYSEVALKVGLMK